MCPGPLLCQYMMSVHSFIQQVCGVPRLCRGGDGEGDSWELHRPGPGPRGATVLGEEATSIKGGELLMGKYQVPCGLEAGGSTRPGVRGKQRGQVLGEGAACG